MKRTALLTGLVTVMMVAGVASAATETFSTNYNEGNPVSTHNMTLAQFDTQGGTRTLTQVKVTFTAQQSASVAFENGTASPVSSAPALNSATVSLAGTGAINLSSDLNISGLTDHDFAANEGPSIPTYNGSGPDFFNFSTITSDLFTGISTKTEIAAMAPFIGASTISYDMDSSGSWVLDGVGDAQATVSGYGTFGTLSVEYTYVPEPATMSLLALGGIAMLKRRKRKQ